MTTTIRRDPCDSLQLRGASESTCSIFPESMIAYSEPFSGKCQRKCDVGGDMALLLPQESQAQSPLITKSPSSATAEGEESLTHCNMESRRGNWYLLASNLLSACLSIYLKDKHDRGRAGLHKVCLAFLLKPRSLHDKDEAIFLMQAVFPPGCCDRGRREGVNRSIPLAVPSLFPQ